MQISLPESVEIFLNPYTVFSLVVISKCREKRQTDNVRKMTEEDAASTEEGQPLRPLRTKVGVDDVDEDIELATTKQNGDVINSQPHPSPLLEEP